MYTILTKTCKMLHVDTTKYVSCNLFIAVRFKKIVSTL